MKTLTRAWRHGTLTFFEDKFIGAALRDYGEYSQEEVDLLCGQLTPGASVLIAGANIGAIAIPIAHHVGGSGTVYAVEPQRKVFDVLKKNIHDLPQVKALWMALGAFPSRAGMWEADGCTGGAKVGEGDEVEVVPIDDLEIDHLDLIHADVEGSETDVLRGGLRTIARCRPLLYLECDKAGRHARLLALLKALDYRVWWHEPRLVPAKPEDAFFGLVSYNVVCAPRERGKTFDLREVGTVVFGPTLPLPDRGPSVDAAMVSAESAAIQRMLAEALRDCGRISDHEMAQFEIAIGPMRRTSRHMFNPYTGEYRRVSLGGWS